MDGCGKIGKISTPDKIRRYEENRREEKRWTWRNYENLLEILGKI